MRTNQTTKNNSKGRYLSVVLFCIIALSMTLSSHAQVAINEDDSDGEATSILDVKSTTKGVIFPKLSETERDNLPSPADGLLIYNRTVGYFNYYNGTKWCMIDRTSVVDPAVNPAGAENDNGVGVGIDDPDNSAILHVNSNNKGVLIPNLSTDVAGAPEGMIYFISSYFRYYDGTAWTNIMGPIEGDPAVGSGTAEGVVIGNSSIDASAKLELYSTDKGLLLPRMTDAQRDAIDSPAEGLLLYNLDSHDFQYYAAGKWYSWSNNTADYGTIDNPGISCYDILSAKPTAVDGKYYIDPDGLGGNDAFECDCDMTTDGGGWTLATVTLGVPPADLFRQNSVNRDATSGNVFTDLTVGNGTWYTYVRWGPAFTRSADWDDVVTNGLNPPRSIYNEQSSGTHDWFTAVGTGVAGFTPACTFKCNWADSWINVAFNNTNYSGFSATNWNLPNAAEAGSTYEGVLPSINLGTGSTLSKTFSIGGSDCNTADTRYNNIQLWVK